MDPRLPVLVGAGELVRHPERDEAPLDDPAAMMAEALRRAARATGAGTALLARAGVLAAVPSAAWPHPNPGARVAGLLGLRVATLRSSLQGGNGPQLLVTALAERVAAGQLEVGLVCGAEALASVVHAGRHGTELGWPPSEGPPDGVEVLDAERAPASEIEVAAGMIAPIMAYPLIENAIRRAAGRTVEEHAGHIAALWSRLSQVAPRRPAAWSPTPCSAAEIATRGVANRAVSFPYLKLMNAHIQVDQAAALIVCAAGTARALGIPRDRWVFIHGGAESVDHWHVTERPLIHRSPAIAACGAALLGGAGIAAEELGPVDLYSCFPAAVELAARELDLPLDDPRRELTCTGGLTFFGGPGNNYATHGIAAVADALRAGSPGGLGLATALGWYATKHALGLYGAGPPRGGFRAHRPAASGAGPPVAVVAPAAAGGGRVLTGTVIYARDGSASYGIVLAELADGRRTVAQTRDRALLEWLVTDDALGAPVRFGADGSPRVDV